MPSVPIQKKFALSWRTPWDIVPVLVEDDDSDWEVIEQIKSTGKLDSDAFGDAAAGISDAYSTGRRLTDTHHNVRKRRNVK